MKVWMGILVILSAALNVWMGNAIIRLENFHYGVQVGMCGQFDTRDPVVRLKYLNCLDAEQTRTNPIWHLVYALTK
jgi:hypothetical protein